MFEIEATIVTGFENVAKEDIEEQLGVQVTAGRGKIIMQVPSEKLEKIMLLSSVDNLYVVLNRFPNFVFPSTEEECMLEMRRLVPKVDWENGLKVWSRFFSFKNPISSSPQDRWRTEFIKELEEGVIVAHDPPTGDSTVQKTVQKSTENNDTGAGLPSDVGSDCPDTSQDGAPSAPKIPRLRDPSLPAFRVTCYRSGKHIFQSPQVAVHFGGTVQDYFGWNVNLKQFDIEVVVTVEEKQVYVSIALTRESRHRRHIEHFGSTTLRPTIAYNMLRMCNIQPGDIVCDPMCGGGSIPVEAALNWPHCLCLSGDLNEQAWQKAELNTDALNKKRSQNNQDSLKIDVLSWDVTNLPLRTSSVDVFITDMPFGKRSGSKMRNWHLYPKTLREMARVVRPSTGRVCLLTQDKKCITKTLVNAGSFWKRGLTCWINIGGLTAGVYLLHRTAQDYS